MVKRIPASCDLCFSVEKKNDTDDHLSLINLMIVGHASEISQKAEKGEPAEGPDHTKPPSDAEKLIAFMEDHYDDVVARVQSFDEFYHAIFELIE